VIAVIDRFRPQDPVLITSYLSSDPVETLTRLRCSKAEIERGREIDAFRHDLPDAESPASVRRWMSRAKGAVDDIVAINVAQGDECNALESAVAQVRESGAALSIRDLAIDGADLMRIGIPKGPEMGRIMGELLSAVLGDPRLNTEQELEVLAEQLFPGPRSPFPPQAGSDAS